MTRPILFLDVDGVINCLGATVPCDHVRVQSRASRASGAGFGDAGRDPLTSVTGRIQFTGVRPDPHASPGIPASIPHGTKRRVAALAARFEVIWCTAWLRDAHPAFAPFLGLPDEPWESLDWGAMKLPAIFDRIDGRPWAFIDDDIDFELREAGITDADIPGPHLLIAPDHTVGITDEHVAQLIAFADQHR